jgi:hypothetical protein
MEKSIIIGYEVKEDKYDMSSWINEIVEEELNKLTI